MNNKTLNPRLIFIIAVILIAAILRLIINIPNVTPIAAMALFGGVFFKKRYLGYLIPLATLFITDLIIGFHSTIIYVYAAFAITVSIGFLIRNKLNVFSVVGASLASSILFFLITNFGVWASGMVGYPMVFAGLIESYVAGIPFFRTEVLGTLVFNGVFFGSFYFAQQRFPVLAKA